MGLWASQEASAADVAEIQQELDEHEGDLNNPHVVTVAQIGAIASADLGQVAGPAGPLDVNGKVPQAQLPPLQHDVGDAADEAGMLALAVTAPAICIRTDFTPAHVFFLTADPATNIANWTDTGEFGGGAADPTATVGPAPTNGTAVTYMRSDAAPGINLTATYAWTGAHTWTEAISVQGGVSVGATTGPVGTTNSGLLMSASPDVADLLFFESGNTANNRTAEWIFFEGKLQGRFKNDAGDAAIVPLAFAGGHALGITGIESNSGSGAWAHIGAFSTTGSQTVLPAGGNGIAVAGTNSSGVPSITALGAANNISLLISGKGGAGVTIAPGLQVNGDMNVTGKFESLTEAAGGQFKIINNGSALSGPQAAFVLQGNNSAGPAIGIGNTSQGADAKWWDIMPVAGSLNFRTVTDAGAPSVTFLTVTRSGAAVTGITSNSGSGAWAHTGDFSVDGDLHMSEKKVVNMGDPAAARDGVNLQTLDGRLTAAQRTAIDALTTGAGATVDDVIAALQAT